MMTCHVLVMELLEGASLADLLASQSEKNEMLTEAKILKILVQVCMALRHMHKVGHVVHRDFTPSNIMFDSEGNVRVTDFGLAKQQNGVMTSMVGTIVYSCPEVRRDDGDDVIIRS